MRQSCIDLFAGCGGLSLGLSNSGEWEGIFAIEKNTDAFATLEANLLSRINHYNWPEWLPKEAVDINEVIKQNNSQLKSLQGDITMIAGGPPCQGFSVAGLRNESDERNTLIEAYVKFVRLVQPKVILFENVKGFTIKFNPQDETDNPYSAQVVKKLQRKTEHGPGYHLVGKLIDFSKFGIPQRRTRFILFGIRKDLKAPPPHYFFKLLENLKFSFLDEKGLSLNCTLFEAISDLEQTDDLVECPDSRRFFTSPYNNIRSNYQKHIRRGVSSDLPDSHRFANHRPKTIDRFKYILENSEKNKRISKTVRERLNYNKDMVTPLSPDFPAFTITTLPDDFIHYSQPRIMTVREHARIQSFDDTYLFKGVYTTGGGRRTYQVPRYSQVGNAIPPLFGELCGQVISKIIRDVQ